MVDKVAEKVPEKVKGKRKEEQIHVIREGGASEDLMALYEESFSGFSRGGIITGEVVAVGPEGVILDIGYKSEGIIPAKEFAHGGMDKIHVGDRLSVFIEEEEDNDGNVILSKERADKMSIWESLEETYRKGEPVEGKVTARIKGGMSVDIGGIKAFLPGSQIDVRPTRDLNHLVGQTHTMKIIKMDQKRGNIVVSRRIMLEETMRKKRDKTLGSIEEGQVLNGVVKNLTDYGAFIDLGGIDGLLHITDMSWGRVGHPSELFKVSDRVEVVVLKYDREMGRVSLGYKQRTTDPWVTVDSKFPVGSRVQGKVVSLTDYGAFVELETGVEGLIHVSEMSWGHEVKHPSKIVAAGDKVDAVVLSMDKRNRRISLGMKQAAENPWDVVERKYTSGTVIQGKVKNITDFGAFVGLDEGVDGLIHVSDISWLKHVRHPSEVLKKGQTISAVVLRVDREKERLSLGLKQMTPDPWIGEIPERYPVGTVVKGKVTHLADFGIFVELEDGVEGLIHVSESGIDPPTRAEDVLKRGDEVTAKVIKIDTAERKIGLSIREYHRDTERSDVDAYLNRQGAGGHTLGDIARKITPPDDENKAGEE
jgi:small subunit ribosomal protein S1